MFYAKSEYEEKINKEKYGKTDPTNQKTSKKRKTVISSWFNDNSNEVNVK